MRKYNSCLTRIVMARPFAAKVTNVGKLDANGEPRFLENVKLFLARAAQNTNIPADILKYIEACHAVVRFNIPLKMDDGTIRTIPCYR
jgi:hypothetical protein